MCEFMKKYVFLSDAPKYSTSVKSAISQFSFDFVHLCTIALLNRAKWPQFYMNHQFLNIKSDSTLWR